jgi:hypothetical protein
MVRQMTDQNEIDFLLGGKREQPIDQRPFEHVAVNLHGIGNPPWTIHDFGKTHRQCDAFCTAATSRELAEHCPVSTHRDSDISYLKPVASITPPFHVMRHWGSVLFNSSLRS